MAYHDRERGELVVRIVYDGPATAGKTANLRSLQATFNKRAAFEPYAGPETATGRTLFFDWLELDVGFVDDWPLRAQILTVPGQLALAERRFRLLHALDAVVFVCESTAARVRASRVALAFLERTLAAAGHERVPVIVQANKQDLAGALSPAELASALALPAERRVIAASAMQDDGVRETFFMALHGAREALRLQVRTEGVASLPTDARSAAGLYEAMTAEADSIPDPAFVSTLEEALGLVS